MIKVTFSRDVEDIEKAILPALIYARREFVTIIALGWWDWSIKLHIINTK
jgi:hypothetical protein